MVCSNSSLTFLAVACLADNHTLADRKVQIDDLMDRLLVCVESKRVRV